MTAAHAFTDDLSRLVALASRAAATAEDDSVVRRALTLAEGNIGRGMHFWRRASARPRGLSGRIESALVDFGVEHERWLHAFRENAEQLRAAQAATGMGLWVSDLVTGVTTWDEAMFAICGTNTELSPQQYLEHVHPEDRAAVEANRRETLERGELRAGNAPPTEGAHPRDSH